LYFFYIFFINGLIFDDVSEIFVVGSIFSGWVPDKYVF